jgi:hypothetical protein
MRVFACLASTAFAATIHIAPGDSYTKMEAAVAGDEVVIAPGSYAFRVDWENAGTPSQPIVVRAEDPANRPVWDLTGIPVGTAPGSYNGGDKHRGCWQFRGGYYRVDGIVFKGCQDDSSAGLRVVNVPSIEVRHCLFRDNTNGMTGAGDGTLIEHSEFDANGLPQTPPAHQIYIFGGTLTVRGSYFHDSPAGQNFHVRARDATLEYNWFDSPGSYTGDIMSCEYFCGGTGTNAIAQKMLLRGNVILQGMPANHSQLIALLNDGGASADGTGQVGSMEITLVYNTIVGLPGVNNAVVHHLNDSGISTAAHLSDNAVTDFEQMDLIEAPAMNNWTVDGTHNWVTTGTDATMLAATVMGADPMWSAAYVPQPGSPLIGAAMSVGALDPTAQYLAPADDQPRAGAFDVGAFESGTVMPDLSASPMDGGSTTGGTTGSTGGTSGGGGDMATTIAAGQSAGGCGCEVGAQPGVQVGWLLLALYLARARCRSPEKVWTSTTPSPEP